MKKTDQKLEMVVHILLKHHQDRLFGCEECGQLFHHMSDYHVHLSIHSTNRDFACKNCGGRIRLLHSLKVHQLVRNEECMQYGKDDGFDGN